MKKIYLLFILVFSLFIMTSCNQDKKDGINIIATNFVGYDFARAVTKDTNANVSMLLKPGAEIHGYEPSTKDIINILDSDVFIYVGGESDSEWVEKSILSQVDKSKTKIVSMFEVVENGRETSLYKEIDYESGEEEDEYDEHLWNDCNNAEVILTGIKNAIVEKDNKNEKKYEDNYKSYFHEINDWNFKINAVVCSIVYIPGRSPYMLVADRFPLLYFVNHNRIAYDAALSGCTTQTEVSIDKLKKLKNKIEELHLKYIFTIELSELSIASTLKQEIKNDINNGSYDGEEIEILTYYSMHNISKDDFEAGLTFADYLKKNYETMKIYIEHLKTLNL